MGQKVHPLIFRSKLFPHYINIYNTFYFLPNKVSYYLTFLKYIDTYKLQEVLYVQLKEYSNNYYLFKIIFYSKESFFLNKSKFKFFISTFFKNNYNFPKICIKFVILKNPLLSTSFILKYISEKIKSTKVSLRKFIPQLAVLINTLYKIKGFKCLLSGRINGIQMAKIETFKFNESSVQHINSFIKYNSTKIHTKYGILGVKI